MFTKEAQELAKPCIEAIKSLAERQEKKCLAWHPSDPSTASEPCVLCNGTGKVKGKWEWKPEVGEWCINKYNQPRLIIQVRQQKNGNWLIMVFEEYGKYEELATSLIPLLHWEKIEEILEGMGYQIHIFDIQVKKRRWLCHIWKKRPLKKTAPRDKLVASVDNCKSRQHAVMRAVIELGKEKANEKN